MSSPTHQAPQEVHQTIGMDRLVHNNADLTLQLQDADTERHLEGGDCKTPKWQIALTTKLEDENNEIGRLTMVINRRNISIETLAPTKKSS